MWMFFEFFTSFLCNLLRLQPFHNSFVSYFIVSSYLLPSFPIVFWFLLFAFLSLCYGLSTFCLLFWFCISFLLYFDQNFLLVSLFLFELTTCVFPVLALYKHYWFLLVLLNKSKFITFCKIFLCSFAFLLQVLACLSLTSFNIFVSLFSTLIIYLFSVSQFFFAFLLFLPVQPFHSPFLFP
jgi:hypothetical protein